MTDRDEITKEMVTIQKLRKNLKFRLTVGLLFIIGGIIYLLIFTFSDLIIFTHEIDNIIGIGIIMLGIILILCGFVTLIFLIIFSFFLKLLL